MGEHRVGVRSGLENRMEGVNVVIKPSDIPDELESMCQGIEWFQCGDMDKPAVAAILNAAIEAGLVSPPCYVWRFNGELQRDANGEPTVWSSRGLDSPDGSISYEHWKGQTE